MNDLLTLESDESGQENKFQLHMSVKNEITEEEDVLDSMSQPVTCDAGPMTTVSVGGTALSDGANSTNRILQGSMTTPVLVLTTTSQRGGVQASVLLDPSSSMAGGAGPWSSLQLSSLHSLAQANLISDTQQQIARQLSAQGQAEEEKGKKEKRTKFGVRAVQKGSSKIKFANDLRMDMGAGPKKQIAIFEPQPSEPKTFVCNIKGCGRKFAWQAHFKYHQLTHTNDRRFVCDDARCGKRFLTAQRLQVHMRTHTGERPFVCQAEDCGKSFTTAGNLKNHSRIHTGERPFVCEMDGCGRRFAEYSSLHKHSLTHSGAKPFSCEICGRSFSQSGSRRVHMNRHKLDEAKKAADMVANGAEMEEVAAVDDSDFKSELSVKVDPPNDVLVLCNSSEDNVHYQDLQNAESVVFPQGLTDHIVTVTTQPADGETESLEMTHDILGAEEVLVDNHMSDPRVGSSVVVLSQPSDMDGLHSSLSHSSLSHSYHDHHHHHHQDDDHHATQSEQQVEYDHSQLLHPGLHHEEITTSHHHHVLAYPPLDPSSQHGHDDQTVAEEIEVGVSSSSSHPQSEGSIHMDPMMESDDEFDALDKHSS